jgi:hypothetical protein
MGQKYRLTRMVTVCSLPCLVATVGNFNDFISALFNSFTSILFSDLTSLLHLFKFKVSVPAAVVTRSLPMPILAMAPGHSDSDSAGRARSCGIARRRIVPIAGAHLLLVCICSLCSLCWLPLALAHMHDEPVPEGTVATSWTPRIVWHALIMGAVMLIGLPVGKLLHTV